MRKLVLILALVTAPFAALAQDAKDTTGAEDPAARFWQARRVMLTGDAASAAELFRTLAAADPKAEKADDCLYWMGRCYLRIPDREPDAVVAFLRVIREHPESPFVDDAARELGRLGDRTVVPELVGRLAGEGASAELAAHALAELGDERGVTWLAEKLGKEVEPPAAPARQPTTDTGDEIRRLKEEIRKLRAELDESLKLLEKLLKEKSPSKGKESDR
jgi:TolA-binding protein